MCGIVGFTGRHQAAPILLDGLSKLEYRGYDSAGIAVTERRKRRLLKQRGVLRSLWKKPTEENQYLEPVVSDIQDGRHMENHP